MSVLRASSVDSLGAQTPKGRPSQIALDTPTHKVVVVGDYAVGKTSLIRQLTTRQFSMQSAATIGVEFKEHRLDNCVLQIWDVAGQSAASSMTKQYYRFATAAAVVADVTKESSFAVALEWRHDIITKMSSATASSPAGLAVLSTGGGGGGGSPVASARNSHASPPAAAATPPIPIFLFANKGDLLGTSSAAEAFDTEEKIMQFAREHGFYGVVITTAKEYDVVVGAFRALAQAAAENVSGDQLSPMRATVQLTRAKREPQKKPCCKK